MQRRAVTLILILMLVFVAIPTSHAQDPTSQVQAAIDALNDVFPGIGQPNQWSYSFGSTTNSNLGCELAASGDLGQRVNAYRVALTYDSTVYIYYVSEDLSIIIPCSPGLIDGDDAQPTATTAPATCTLTATVAAANVREGPSTDEAIIGTTSRSQSYPVTGRLNDNTWYQIQYAGGQAGWVGSSVAAISGDCTAVPVVSVTTTQPTAIPTSAPACNFFSNGAAVRTAPDKSAETIETLQSGALQVVLGTSVDGAWYYVQLTRGRAGWVDGTDGEVAGGCETLPVVNTGPSDSPVSATCPADFSGYLTPRIGVGSTNVTVAEGVFLAMRDAPSPQGNVVASVPPGLAFDAVLDGPACTAGSVWWQVELDSFVGWIPESNAGSGLYYVTGTMLDPARITPENLGDLTVQAQIDFGTVVIDVAWSSNSALLVVVGEESTQVITYPDLEPATAYNDRLATIIGDTVTAATFDPNGVWLALGYQSGMVRLLNLEDGTLTTLLNGHTEAVSLMVLNADGLLATINDTADQPSLLKVWDVAQLDRGTGFAPAVVEVTLAGAATGLAFGTDGMTLAVSIATGVQVYDALTGTELAVYESTADAGAIRAAHPAWATSGFVFAEGDTVNLLALDGEPPLEVTVTPDSPISDLDISPTPDAEDVPVLAVTGESGLALFADDVEPLLLTEDARLAAFSPNGHVLAVVTGDFRLGFWGVGP